MRWGKAAVVVTASAVGAGVVALIAGRVVSEISVRAGGAAPASAGGLRVHSVEPDRVELTRAPETERPGVWALEWGADGHVVVGDVLARTAQTVVRAVLPGGTALPEPGEKVVLTPWVLRGDPRSALGLDFSETAVATELGAMPAWYLPGLRDPWVIAVHGMGADRAQVLPLLPVFEDFKLPVLSVSYRNDPGAPPSPDGIGHFGETEWRDVEAAIRLAVDSGASRVLLYGWGLGATMAMYAAERSAWRDYVRGLVLDSPVLDFRTSTRRRATRLGVPQPLAELGTLAAQGRADVDTAGFDHLASGDGLHVPALVLHSPDDTIAPIEPVRRLARRRDDLVLFREFPGTEHEALWNADPHGYEDVLRRFVTPLL
ncbi:alpha/beta hydrolase family protein [Streptacidiphilus melanogenes]|uniref:alpha/beta hydrolase family protein n=1 Tax=Streptacidiphilus melanogenes TaxID=411235 RepID=UPI0005A87425|nr:alpha/beta hydrolase [Streptacidiphilus melanogenes]